MRSNRLAANRDRRSRTSPHWNRSRWSPRTVESAASRSPHPDPEELGLSIWLERSRLARPLGFDVVDHGVSSVTSPATPLNRDPRQQARFASAFLALSYRALQGGWPGVELAPIGGCLERLVMDLAAQPPGPGTMGAALEFRPPPILGKMGRFAPVVEELMRETLATLEQGLLLERDLALRPLEALGSAEIERWFQDVWATRLFLLPARLALALGGSTDRVRRELEVLAHEFARATWCRLDVAHWAQIQSGGPLEDPRVPRLSPSLVRAHQLSPAPRRQLLARCLTDGGRSPLQLVTAARIVGESGAPVLVQEEAQSLLRSVHERMKTLGGSSRLARMSLEILR